MATARTPAPEVGIPEIDLSHRELHERLEKLRGAIVGGDRDEVARLLEFVGEYVVAHFGAEESRMLEAGYPDYPVHKAEHDLFIQEYLRYSVELEQKGPTVLVGMRVSNWVSAWFQAHVSGSDVALGRYLRQGGG